MLAIYRVGFQIQLPIIDQHAQCAVRRPGRAAWATCCEAVAMLSASQLDQVTIFGLGIMPYISASIIFQLLGQRLSAARAVAEGRRERAARKSTNTRATPPSFSACSKAGSTCGRSSMPQGLGAARASRSAGGADAGSWKIVAVLTMTAGTVFLMWLGEQIDEFGIGNGISLLIMAGILARMPGAGYAAAAEGRRSSWAAAAASSASKA